MAFSFLFPGQGSQYTGMFKEHFEEFDEFQENLSIAEEFYKEDLKNIIFQEDPRLNDTYYTQPLLMVMSFSLFQVWKNLLIDLGRNSFSNLQIKCIYLMITSTSGLRGKHTL